MSGNCESIAAMRPLSFLMASSLCLMQAACDLGSASTADLAADSVFKPDPKREYPSVSNAAAPTIGNLKKRGFQEVNQDGEPFACGPACDAVYIYARFMGERKKWPERSVYRFTCPNPKSSVADDAWQCVPFTGIRSAR
jgi:hypothetical protein